MSGREILQLINLGGNSLIDPKKLSVWVVIEKQDIKCFGLPFWLLGRRTTVWGTQTFYLLQGYLIVFYYRRIQGKWRPWQDTSIPHNQPYQSRPTSLKVQVETINICIYVYAIMATIINVIIKMSDRVKVIAWLMMNTNGCTTEILQETLKINMCWYPSLMYWCQSQAVSCGAKDWSVRVDLTMG